MTDFILYKDAVFVLDELIRSTKPLSSETLSAIPNISKRFCKEDINDTLDFLQRKGIVSYAIADDGCYNITLTEFGKHCIKSKQASIKKFIFCSIIIPVDIAFFTSVLTILWRLFLA